jgi:hypothetical protein
MTNTELVIAALRGYAAHVANGGAYDTESWVDLANNAADILDATTSAVERAQSFELLLTFTPN